MLCTTAINTPDDFRKTAAPANVISPVAPTDANLAANESQSVSR